MPIWDVLEAHFDNREIERMMESRILEIAPLAFMRGRTFEKSWVICDEAQNITNSQMLMMLTRIGKDSKMVFTGDPCQHDRKFNADSGLITFLRMMENATEVPDIRALEFDDADVERHHLIPYILRLYASNKE
jgi:phosphate starvation-inducible protein PhoH and related proteins